MKHVTSRHIDSLVITVETYDFLVKRILVGSEIITHIIFIDTLQALGKMNNDWKKVDFPFIRLVGRTSYPFKVINFPVVLSKGLKALWIKFTFIWVFALNSYNAILGRTTLSPNKIITSTCNQKMKFPSLTGLDK